MQQPTIEWSVKNGWWSRKRGVAESQADRRQHNNRMRWMRTRCGGGGGGGGRGTNYDNDEAFGGDKRPSSRDKRQRCNMRRRQFDNQLGQAKGRKGTENERHDAGAWVVENLVEVRWMLQSPRAGENERWWRDKRWRRRRTHRQFSNN
jgi:hypothetical protein